MLQVYRGILYRDGATSVAIDGKKGDQVDIVVENMGRVGYSSDILHNTKGIICNVTIGHTVNVTGWTMTPIQFNQSLLPICDK